LKIYNRINRQIRAGELRVIGEEGENFGVISLEEALRLAKEKNLDLIEISSNSIPPVAKIADYGRFQYAEKKKLKEAKTKSHVVEVKSLQVKIGTDDHDLLLKAEKASEWLKDGHRVKLNLFLPGRSKYMNKTFLKERIERMLKLLTENYKIAEEAKASLKGMTMVIEKDNKPKIS